MGSQVIWKAKRQVTQIHIKENSKTIWTFAHISMYTGLRVKSTYIREKRFKSRLQQIRHVFRDDLGNIKIKNGPWGPKNLQRDKEGHEGVIHHVW